MKRKIFLFIVLITAAYFAYTTYLYPVEGNMLITDDYKQSSIYENDMYKSDEYFKKKLLTENEYYIYERIITASKNDEYDIIINCGNDCYNEIYTSTLAISLDHPELISYTGMSGYANVGDHEIKYHNYTNLDKIKTDLGTRRILRIIDKIKKETKEMSDKDKIIYVYNYVASHNYDYIFTYSKSNQSAYSFFTGGKSVCAGFAKASQLIFQNIGIKSYLATGSNHMWNYVQYEGKYYIFDATYGASFRNKEDSRYYDGLGNTTTGVTKCLYSEYYPEISEDKLKNIFGL